MCLYANGFARGRDEKTLILPESSSGLLVSLNGEIHPAFSKEFEGQGVILTFHDGHCLCQFEDWRNLFLYAEEIRLVNDLERLSLMLFWTSDEYPTVKSVDFDITLDNIDQKPEQGTIFDLGVSVKRRLSMNLNQLVEIIFKNGKIMRGVVESLQEAEGYGVLKTDVESIYFNTKEIQTVSSLRE
ncbi:MAG: hypothetical protein ACFE7R_04770 [Candidatus Hodarchaeota archaeon]